VRFVSAIRGPGHFLVAVGYPTEANWRAEAASPFPDVLAFA